MRFFSPLGFLLSAALPAILAMWFLKLKGQEQKVASNLIWRKLMTRPDRGQPFDKLKRSILLYLQLLAALLVMLAAVNPYMDFLGTKQKNVFFILDNSGSMSRKYGSTTAFQEAKKQIRDAVNSGGAGETYTLIEAGSSPETIVFEAQEKGELLSALDGIEASYGIADMNAALDLAEAAVKENGGRIESYTDHQISLPKGEVRLHVINQPGENWGIEKISGGGSIGTAIVTVTNYGSEKGSREISLFSENKLSDVGSIELEAGKTGQLILNGVKGAKTLKAVISEEDSIQGDNTCYFVPERSEKKVAVIGKDSVFLNRAASLVSGIKLYQLEASVPLAKGYDLYILSGLSAVELSTINLKENLPDAAPVILIGGGAGIIDTNGKAESAIAMIQELSGMKQMAGETFAIREGLFAAGKWGQDVAVIDGKALIRYGEYGGRKVGYIGFDLNDSDFVLNTAFPIIMDTLLRYGADIEGAGGGNWHCGENIRLSVPTDATQLTIRDPEGVIQHLKPGGGETYLADSGKPGLYRVEGKGRKEFQFQVPVNFPPEESVRNTEKSGVLISDGSGMVPGGKGLRGKYLRNGLLVILLLVLLIEGEVYRRGY